MIVIAQIDGKPTRCPYYQYKIRIILNNKYMTQCTNSARNTTKPVKLTVEWQHLDRYNENYSFYLNTGG